MRSVKLALLFVAAKTPGNPLLPPAVIFDTCDISNMLNFILVQFPPPVCVKLGCFAKANISVSCVNEKRSSSGKFHCDGAVGGGGEGSLHD